ncbi:MAG: hypothetical protein WBA10_19870, partial [Elainellaceae cyanobacterium]
MTVLLELLRRRIHSLKSRRLPLIHRRSCRRIGYRRNSASAGFVLPTTTMLLLVVSLSIGAMVLRAYDQTAQTSSDRQRQAIVNAASPAVDRAKAKLDYLLDRRTDPRLPAGTPHQKQLQRMLLNRQDPVLKLDGKNVTDPYTFPDETRLDINGDGAMDNAWRYHMGGDGSNPSSNSSTEATVLYGIWLLQPDPKISEADQARQGIVRHGPLGNAHDGDPLCHSRYSSSISAAYADAGWTAALEHPSRHRKNFQVDVLVLPDRPG